MTAISSGDPILNVRDLCKSYGSLVVTDHLNLEVHSSEFHALIGPNGAGKTTLLGQIFGETRSDSGKVFFKNADVTARPSYRRADNGMARTYQITSIYHEFSAEDNVAIAVQAATGHSFRLFRPARTDPELRRPAKALLDQVGLGERGNLIAGALSHGEQRQLEVAMALASKPRLILLDEPMAGLGKQESLEMLALLQRLKGSLAVLMVEHDMSAVFALADRITVLVYGKAIATGSLTEIQANRQVRAAYLGDEPCS